jgi:Chlorophyll A-B binding protein
MADAKKTNPSVSDNDTSLWGFTSKSEIWNGRFAMIGFLSAVLLEVFSGKGVLHFWGIL